MLTILAGDRKLATSQLLPKLKEIHSELSKIEQEEADLASLSELVKETNLKFLLQHKDNGVKSYLCCIIADLLRLYAPEPPYDNDVLEEVFSLFFGQLRLLSNPNDAYFNLAFYLLESLATIRTVILVIDLNQNLIVKLFRNFFQDIK